MSTSASPWVAVHSDLWTSLKLQRLARLLKVTPEQAVGHLLRLWHSQVTASLTGELENWSADDLAWAAGWQSDSVAFADALVATRWVHKLEGRVGFQLHEWSEYGGAYLRERKANAERKAAQRDPLDPGDPAAAPGDSPEARTDPCPTDVPGTSQGQAWDIPVTSHATGQTGQDKEERRGERGERSLATERAKVIKDNRDARRAKLHASEVVYDRPQKPEALLAYVHPDMGGRTVEQVWRERWPLFDGKDGRVDLLEKVSALFASAPTGWAPAGTEVLRWFANHLTADYQKVRQSEHIIAEKQARGVTVATDESDQASKDRYELHQLWLNLKAQDKVLGTFADFAKGPGPALLKAKREHVDAEVPEPARVRDRAGYDHYCETIPPQDRARGATPSWADWQKMGSPARWTNNLPSQPLAPDEKAPPDPEGAEAARRLAAMFAPVGRSEAPQIKPQAAEEASPESPEQRDARRAKARQLLDEARRGG